MNAYKFRLNFGASSKGLVEVIAKTQDDAEDKIFAYTNERFPHIPKESVSLLLVDVKYHVEELLRRIS